MSIIKIREQALKKIMVPVVGLLLVALLVGVFVSFSPGRMGERDRNNEQGAANTAFVINKHAVTDEFFQLQLQQIRQQSEDRGTEAAGPMQMSQVRGQLINSIVGQELLAEAARTSGLSVPRRELNSEMDKMVTGLVNQYKMALFGKDGAKASDDVLDKELRSRKGITVQDLKAQLDNAPTRDAVESALLAKKLEATVRGRVQLSDAALQDSFRTVTVRHILISTSKRPDASAKKMADDLLAKLKGGADFAKLARSFSDDPGSARQGGLLPAMTSSSGFVAEFRDAALRLKSPGELSPVVKTQFGYHIIRLEKSEVKLPAGFATRKDQIRKQQQQALSDQAWSETIAKVRNEAKITFKDPEFEGYWELAQSPSFGRPAPDVLAKAANDFQNVIADTKRSSSDTAYIELARIKQMQGKPKEAAAVLENGFKNFEDGATRLLLAQIYLSMGDKKSALKQYQLASDVSGDFMVHLQLADVFKKKFPDAVRAKKSQEIVDNYMREHQSEMQPQQVAPKSSSKAPSGGR